MQSQSGNFFDFTAAPPFWRVFRSCKTTLWHTSATWQRRTPISQLRNGLQKFPSSVKSTPRCENAPSFKMAMKMLQASKWATKLPFGCEMISQPHSYPLPNPPFVAKMAFWLWNDFPNFEILHPLQKWSPSFKMATKWLLSFKMGYENVSIFSMGCKNVFLFSLWLQDDL